MNKIRSPSQLSDLLDEEIAWRKKELTTVNFMISSRRKHERKVLLRSAICALYAHWEGFVKATATAYVCFVATQGLKYSELTPNFIALGLRSRISSAGLAKKLAPYAELTTYLLFGLAAKANIPWNEAIDTQSNLSSEVLHDILCALGLDGTSYLTKKALIDESLVRNRHQVAHGQHLDIEQSDYELVYGEVIRLMEQFRTDVENAASLQSYRNSPIAAAPQSRSAP